MAYSAVARKQGWLMSVVLALCMVAGQLLTAPGSKGFVYGAFATPTVFNVHQQAAKCSLFLTGERSKQRAAVAVAQLRIKCTDGTIRAAWDASLVNAVAVSPAHVALNPPGCGTEIGTQGCLVTICDGTAVFQDSSVVGIQGTGTITAILCTAGRTNLTFRNSTFANNTVQGPGIIMAYGVLKVTEHSSVQMTNCQIKNNKITNAVVALGAGIAAADQGNLNITGCVIAHNSVNGDFIAAGGGMFLGDQATATIFRSSFKGNLASGNSENITGGAIAMANTATLLVRESNFTSNAVTGNVSTGGAVALGNEAVFSATDTYFQNNTAFGSGGSSKGRTGGGAIGAGDNSLVKITSSMFSNNTAASAVTCGGGAIAVAGDALLQAQDVTMQLNLAIAPLAGGGALAVIDRAKAQVQKGYFGRNLAGPFGSDLNAAQVLSSIVDLPTFGGGACGAVAVLNNAFCQMQETVFFANTAAGFDAGCGALCVSDGAKLSLDYCRLSDNIASHDQTTDAQIIRQSSSNDVWSNGLVGGGAACVGAGSLTADHCIFVRNKARIVSNATLYGFVTAGAITMGAGRCFVDISNSVFDQNSAVGDVFQGSGGALGAVNNATLHVYNTSFTSNYAAGKTTSTGGAIFLGDWSNSSFDQCVFRNNTAGPFVNQAGSDGLGGAIGVISYANSRIRNSLIENNTATGIKGSGGGLHTDGNTTLSVSNTRFYNNRAASGGGLAGTGREWSITNCDISRHSTPGVGAGVMILGSTAVSLRSTTISSNRGSEGAGLYAYSFDEPYNLSVFNTTITDNMAMIGGGCLFRGGNTYIRPGTMIANNSASQQAGGLGWLSGCLGVGKCPSSVNISCGVKITQNTADVVGGGVFVGANTVPDLMSDMLQPTSCMQAISYDNRAAFGDNNTFYVKMVCGVGERMVGRWCESCPIGMYSFSADIACSPCPDHAQCPGGSVVLPHIGYWHSHNFSSQSHLCPNPSMCSHSSLGAQGMDWQCGEGYHSVLCGSCGVGYGSHGDFMCGRCMSPASTIALYFVALLCVLSLLTFTSYTAWLDNQQIDHELKTSDILKLLLLYVQYLVIIGSSSASLDWPRSLTVIFTAVEWVMSSNTGKVVSLDCVLQPIAGYLPLAVVRQIPYLLAPVAMVVAVVLVHFAGWCICSARRCWRSFNLDGWHTVVPLSKTAIHWLLPRVPVIFVVVLYWYFPSLVRVSLHAFACYPVDAPGSYAAAPGTYWISDMGMPCWQGWHKTWALCAGIPCVLLFCFLVPAGMFWLLTHKTRSHRNVASGSGFGFMCHMYRYQWWEVVVAMQTIVLVCIAVFGEIAGTYYKLVMLVAAFSGILAMLVWVHPSVHIKSHRLQIGANACLYITCVVALTFFNIGDVTVAPAYKEPLGAVVLVLNLGFMAWCVCTIIAMSRGYFQSVISKGCAFLRHLCDSWLLRSSPPLPKPSVDSRSELAGSLATQHVAEEPDGAGV